VFGTLASHLEDPAFKSHPSGRQSREAAAVPVDRGGVPGEQSRTVQVCGLSVQAVCGSKNSCFPEDFIKRVTVSHKRSVIIAGYVHEL
jgi:hypothetical protein